MNDDSLTIQHIGEMTMLLQRLEDEGTDEDVFLLCFTKLRRIAGSVVRENGRGLSLEASDVLQEFYVRFKTHNHEGFNNTQEFLAWAWMKMKNVVWDYARRKYRTKRGGSSQRIDIEDVLGDLRLNGLATADVAPEQLLDLQKLLQKLEQRNKRDSDLVDLYYFAGLSQAEIGEQLTMREQAVKDRLKIIRIWLRREYLQSAEHPH